MTRRGVPPLICAFVMAASVAQAQTTTADGVAAFVRGDYQRAAEILKPIAEAWAPRDTVAEFFMAMLYEDGRGVPVDQPRACALYIRSSSGQVLGQQADGAMRNLQRSLTPEQFHTCMLLANVGLHHRFQPVTFSLEHGQWITIDLEDATVSYQGTEKRTPHGLASGGAIIVSVNHTDLSVGPDRSGHRHFIELFSWVPARTGEWKLSWRVFEVVRTDFVAITSQTLRTVAAERPPADAAFDPHQLAQLRVTDAGEAEWMVDIGPDQRSEIIESDADKRARIDRQKVRDRAYASVDWIRVRDPRRPPALLYADGDGCGHIFVYGWSADRMEAITIRADKNALRLSTGQQTLDLSRPGDALAVLVDVFERPVRTWPFCTDILLPMGVHWRWRAVRGTLTIDLGPPGVGAPRGFHRATVRIADAEFVNEAGIRVKQVEPIVLTAVVGAMFG